VAKLQALGIRVFVVWQCELDDVEKCENVLGNFIGSTGRRRRSNAKNGSKG